MFKIMWARIFTILMHPFHIDTSYTITSIFVSFTGCVPIHTDHLRLWTFLWIIWFLIHIFTITVLSTMFWEWFGTKTIPQGNPSAATYRASTNLMPTGPSTINSWTWFTIAATFITICLHKWPIYGYITISLTYIIFTVYIINTFCFFLMIIVINNTNVSCYWFSSPCRK